MFISTECDKTNQFSEKHAVYFLYLYILNTSIRKRWRWTVRRNRFLCRFCFYTWCKLVSCTIRREEIMGKCSNLCCVVFTLFEFVGFFPCESIFFKTAEIRDFIMWRIKKKKKERNPLKIFSVFWTVHFFLNIVRRGPTTEWHAGLLCSCSHSGHQRAIATFYIDSESRY